MPFTFAHPAAVLPFKFIPRKYYSWTGLIIGSMVPDFEAFINMGGDKALSHSWIGMFIYDLPIGLMLALVFHFIVCDSLVDHLPAFLKRRFLFLKTRKRLAYFKKRWLVVLVSLILGITTHLCWDRMTHTDTYTYTRKVGIYLPPSESAQLRQWLQWGCSILGLIIITWELLRLPKDTNSYIKQIDNYWLVTFTLAIVIWVLRANFYYEGDDLINSAIGALLWSLITASVYANRNKRLPSH